MTPYIFFKHQIGAGPPTFDFHEFESDAAAHVWALGMLTKEPRYYQIEVWDGVTKPFDVRRPA